MSKVQLLLMLLVVFLLGACAQGAKDPYSANTAEILFGDNVQQYLAERRAELQRLNSRAAALDERMLDSLGQIHRLEKDLEAARAVASATGPHLAQLHRDVADQKARAEAAFEKTTALQSQVLALEQNAEVAWHDMDHDRLEIAALSREIAELEEYNRALNQVIEQQASRSAQPPPDG